MTIYYFDTSALLKRYRTETGTDFIDELFGDKDDSESFTTSYFTVLEVTSVASRLLKIDSISKRTYNRLLGRLAQDTRETIALQSITDSILSDAIGLIIEHTLRAGDAVHLATVLTTHTNLPDQPVVFVCSDVKLKDACSSHGLPVLDPEDDDSIKALRVFRDDKESAQEG